MALLRRAQPTAAQPASSWREVVSLLLVAVAAARSWGSLSWDDRRLVAAWAATTLVLPAWRRFAPARSPRTRAALEAALQLCNTASPTALSVSLVSAGTMARLQRLQNAALFLAGAATSKGGLWGALHGLVLARPLWQQLPAHAAIWWLMRRVQRRLAGAQH